MSAPARSRRVGGPLRVAPDVWLLAVSLAAGIGAARLTRAPGAAAVVGPIVATVVAGHVATSVARRLRWSVPAALGVGVVAIVLTTVWGQLSSATRYGIPTLSSWHLLLSRFEEAGATIRSNPTPVPATPGVVLCVATGAALVAVLGRSIWALVEWRAARPLLVLSALAPSFGLFCYAALLSSGVDRVAGAVTYLTSALAFVVTADHGAVGAGAPAMGWRQGREPRLAPSGPDTDLSASERGATPAGPGRARGRRFGVMGIVPALLGAALAITAPLAVSPALSTLKVSAIPFGQQGGGLGLGGADGGPSGGPGATGSSVGTFGIGGSGSIGGTGASGVRTIDLVDNLQAVLTDRSGEVMFKAQTPHPTYWQMAVLTTFNGEAWVPDPTTESAAQAIAQPLEHSVAGLPALAQPRSTPTYRATVTIENLESTLLPLPPTTTSVGSVATVVPGFGAVQPVESPPGETFTAVAHLPVKPSAADRPSGSGSARAEVPASSLAPYLALPAVSQQIVRLAHQIVAHADNPAAKAAALARWFDTGRFRYTLSPPPSTGADPLSTFLFVTRAGFCQQFAAAYAVLARLDGLPTRVAIGFTTGAALGRDRYAVTGADAHVWPEVYLGPEAGWTSYEPTPATSTEPTGIGVNAGTHSAGQVPSLPTSATSSTVTPSRHVVPPRLPVPSTVPLLHRHSAAGTVTGTSRAPVTVAVAIGAVVLVAVAALWMVARRRRPPAFTGLDRWRARRLRRPASGDPSDEVLARWREAAWILDRGRLGKLPSETLQEHAARLSSLARAQWLGSRPAAPGPAGTPEPMGQVEAAVAAYGRLAALAARAAYGDDTCTSDDALDAVRLGAVVRSGMAPVPAGRGSSGAGRDTRVPV